MKPLVAVTHLGYEIERNREEEHHKSYIRNPKSRQSCSSAWLEHYTDNVGVSSSNLLGTTIGKVKNQNSKVKTGKAMTNDR